MGLSIRYEFKPGDGDLANAIAEAIATSGKELTEEKIAAIIKRCSKVAMMSTGKMMRNALQSGMDSTPSGYQRTRYAGVLDIASVLAANRPREVGAKPITKRGVQGQILRAVLATAKERPLFGKLRNAVRYEYGAARNTLVVGFIRAGLADTAAGVQEGGDIEPGRDFGGNSISMRRYMAALGMPIRRDTTLTSKPRQFFQLVLGQQDLPGHLERRFVQALDEKLG